MAAALSLRPRHWLYLDEHRSHELHAQIAVAGDQAVFVTTEFPAGSHDPAEVVQTNVPIKGEDELLLLLREVEDRLSLTGRYFRADVSRYVAASAADAKDMQWAPLPPPLKRNLDLRAHEAALPGVANAKMRFHHFHGSAEGTQDRLLIGMPRPDAANRHILAAMDFAFPYVDQGSLQVLHTRLSAATLASTVVREHIEAPRKGFLKLFEARDYENAYGDGWLDKTKLMLSRATARLVGGAPVAPEPLVEPKLAPPDQLARIRDAIGAARIEDVRNRFIDRPTRDHLVEGGEHAIRRYVNALRKTYSHALAYDLSILEAALLVEYALPSQMWDLAGDEGAKLLRYLHGYG